MSYLRPAIIALLALAVMVLGEDTADAASFNPTATASVADSTPGANSDVITTFNIDAPDSNYSTLITFTPPQWGVADDADVPDGALAAQLSAVATVGLLNSACNASLAVAFDMLDATTDMSATTTFDDQFDIVSGLPLGVTMYPDYLTRILVDENGTPLQPRARMYGQTVVTGIDLSLNFAVLAPGTNLRGTDLDPALGFPSVIVLQSTGDPAVTPEPSAISDWCSPLSTMTTTFGVTKNGPTGIGGGVPYRTNPGDGTYNFMTFVAGQHDADGDRIENSMDTCPFDPDPNWDPRSASNPNIDDDPDAFNKPTGDGIPISCDPLPNNQGNPGVGFTNDHDGDGYHNRQDNCPLVKNSKGIPYVGAGGPDNQKDSDNDGIGDACDPNPNVPDGDLEVVCLVSEVTIGAGGPAPPAPNICTGDAVGIDLNGDGVFDSLEEGGDGVGVTAVTIDCPPSATADTPFTCAVDVAVHNNGPISPVGVGGAVNVGVPQDCTVDGYTMNGQGFGTLPLAASVSQTVSKEFNITCTAGGLHQFVGCAIVQIRDVGVVDPDLTNNFGTGYAFTDIDDPDLLTAGRCTTVDPPEVCGDGIDNDADTLVDEEPDTDGDGVSDCDDGDDDGDGFSDALEAFLGTDPLAACPVVAGVHPAWPPDFDDSRQVDITDVLALKPAFGSTDGDGAYVPRNDLTGDGAIDIVDVLGLKPHFGTGCV